MKTRALFQVTICVVLVLFTRISSGATFTTTNLLPGVTFHDGPEELSGKLVFLVSREPRRTAHETNSASIYEFHLHEKRLRNVCDAPGGEFVPSVDGRSLYSVRYWTRGGDPSSATNVFIYSDVLGKARLLYLRKPPEDIVLFGGRVFVQTPQILFSEGTKILEYDPDRDVQRMVGFTNASKWDNQDYRSFKVSPARKNLFAFEYAAHGKRLEGGIDYSDGYYCLHLDTGEISRLKEEADKIVYEDYFGYNGYKTVDGRYVFFEGPEGSTAPAIGHTLVSSPVDWFHTQLLSGREGTNTVKVLKTFPEKRPDLYILKQMSPDRRYVLIMLSVPYGTVFSSIDRMGYLYTFYLVDVQDGKTRILLEDEAIRKTKGFMSPI